MLRSHSHRPSPRCVRMPASPSNDNSTRDGASSRGRSWSPWLLLLALALAVAGWLLTAAPWQAGQDAVEEDRKPGESSGQIVSLSIELGDGRKLTIDSLAWRPGMTVLEALRQASRREEYDFSFESRGEGDAILVTAIGGEQNQGGGSNARNWIYRVNGKVANHSAAVHRLSPGDVVQWRFETYDQ